MIPILIPMRLPSHVHGNIIGIIMHAWKFKFKYNKIMYRYKLFHQHLHLYVGAIHFTSSYSRFGRGVDASLTNFLCYGNESQLLSCTYSVGSVGSCSRYSTAGVQCYGEVISGML